MSSIANIFSAFPSYFIGNLITFPKQTILNASEVNRQWHSILNNPTFIRKWLERNGMNFPLEVPDLEVRNFFKNCAFSNIAEIPLAMEKIFSKNAPIHIGFYFHNSEIENSLQLHENTINLEKFNPKNPSHFLILPLDRLLHKKHIEVTISKRDGRKFFITTHGDDEAAKVRDAVLNHLGICE